MSKQLLFLHFGMQCPYHEHLITRLKAISAETGAGLETIDFAGRPDICRVHRIFSPTLLLVNGRYRWNGPFDEETVLQMLDDHPPERKPYAVIDGLEEFRGDLVPYDSTTAALAAHACFLRNEPGLCAAKAAWAKAILERTGLPHLGYLHLDEGHCIGGAEYLPIGEVPYPIPGPRAGDAFITCSYLSNAERDCKAYPLARLLESLRELSFKRALVIASRDVAFPNGLKDWFERRGFRDLGEIAREEREHAVMHMMEYLLE